jgi:hypothetical protein
MAKTYFEEIQWFRNNRWFVIMILVVSLASTLPIADGLYWQIFRNKPWGNKPMSDEGLIFLFIFIVSVSVFIAWMFLNMRLEVKIDSEGIHYRFFPHKRNWELITKNEIASYEMMRNFGSFTKRKVSRHARRFGYHRNPFNKTRSMRICGRKHLFLQLNNGEKIVIGTQNFEGMSDALQKFFGEQK